ncbi:MAG TPA: phosphohistidine phosphatase SixA [Syntrophales bacterium]|nr:phosphohistidine phosphatase SixA [Syntrophales bacterium]
MSLYLVQHGESLPKEINPDRPLSEEGKATVHRIAKTVAEYHIRVSQIIHSGKTRARQTAEIISMYIKPELGIRESTGLDPNDDVYSIASTIKGPENFMIVGHLPFLERLVSFLITGTDKYTIVKFQNGGIVCFYQETEKAIWYIKWMIMPEKLLT